VTVRDLEQLMVDSRQRLAAILQTSMDAIVVINDGGAIQSFNAAAERMFGCSERDVEGTQVERLVPDRFVQTLRRDLEQRRHSEQTSDGPRPLSVTSGVAADGQEFPCEAWASRQIAGGQRQFVMFVRDVTGRRQAEQALRVRTEFETFLFDLSTTFIGLPEERVDADMQDGLARVGTFLQMDRVTLLELTATEGELVVAYSWSSPGVADAAARNTKQSLPWWMAQVLSGEVSLITRLDDLPSEAAAEKEYLRQRGVASAASIPLRVGGQIAGAMTFVTAHRHVSWNAELIGQLRAIGDILWNALKRRQAMQALLATQRIVTEREERFRLAMNNVASGLYTLDLQGLVTYMNPAAEAMFGWTLGDLLGKKMHDMTHYMHPDGTPFAVDDCPCFQVLRTEIELREQPDMFIRKDGSLFPVVYNVSPLKRDGATVGVVVGFRDDTERREAERAIRNSEERFRLIASTAPVVIWMSDVNQQVTYVNESWMRLTGLPREAALANRWADVVHPDDIERARGTYANAYERREPFQMEYRLRRYDGEFRWIFLQGVPRFNAEQSFEGYIGSGVDVTDRKEAEQLLSTLSQRLIEAQEQERARVARELHDDISQRLALLLLDLENARQRVEAPHGEIAEELRRTIEIGAGIAADVQSLSRRLHSSKLKVGLEAAASSFCREVSERNRVEVHFQALGHIAPLPDEVSLCLYRVLQEALQNAVKHSGAQQIDVSLQGSACGIALSVRDSGVGFQLDEVVKGRRGLGLVSMKERLKLVLGELTIDSRPQEGTTIRACVQLSAGSRSRMSYA
jgi:PAS domain S-box-containing protein